jgi:hypothetical protein
MAFGGLCGLCVAIGLSCAGLCALQRSLALLQFGGDPDVLIFVYLALTIPMLIVKSYCDG